MPNNYNRFHPATPILRVKDLQASIDYYVTSLGFKLDWQDPGIIASVSRDESNLMIVENDQSAPGAWVWIGVQDTDALYDEILKNGGMIRVKPTNYWWAYEMQVDDLDGNVLRFGAENKENEPYGPWLDAQNNLWVMNDEKVWTKKD